MPLRFGVDLHCPEAKMRKIQLLLQAKILRGIAGLLHGHGADYRLWDDAVAGWPDGGYSRAVSS